MSAPTAQIYSMGSKGQDQTNLSAAGGGASQVDIQPSVSPDGKRIAFTRVDLATFSGGVGTIALGWGTHPNSSTGAPRPAG